MQHKRHACAPTSAGPGIVCLAAGGGPSLARLNGIEAGKPLPARLLVLRWGVNKTLKGDYLVNARTVSELSANQAARGWDRPVIDIEHASVPGTKLYQAAADNGKFPELLGSGVPLVVPGEGLFLDGIVWGPKSERAYEFPDLSGAVVRAPDGSVVAIHSLAFCCHGAAEGITALAAPDNTPEEKSMESLLRALLGLGEDADLAGAEALAKAASLAAALDALAKKPAATAETLSAAETRIAGTVATLSASVQKLRRDRVLDAAAAAGKIVTPAVLTACGDDLDKLSAVVDALPAGQVPTDRHSTDGSTAVSTLSAADKSAEAEVAKKFGRTPEDLRGY